MANWDHLIPHSDDIAVWLREQGLPGPRVPCRARLPSAPEVTEAAASLGLVGALALDELGGDGLRARGDRAVLTRALRALAASCGPLWVWPDTGEAPLWVEAALTDADIAHWLTFMGANDGWEQVLGRRFGDPRSR